MSVCDEFVEKWMLGYMATTQIPVLPFSLLQTSMLLHGSKLRMNYLLKLITAYKK